MPSGLNCTLIDPECRINYLRSLGDAGPRVALSNSLGFGGTNCSVVIGRLK
jgi:3-oxoacyl-[acyl-carrier-protein] synthase-1